MAGMRPRVARSALFTVLVVTFAGCGQESADPQTFTECVRSHAAWIGAWPRPITTSAEKRGWALRRVVTKTNELGIIETSGRQAAREALREIRDVVASLEPQFGGSTHPPPHRVGELVYWWAREPNQADGALFHDCLDD